MASIQPPGTLSALRYQGYPWDDWTNGETWQIEYGVDFTCKLESMTFQLYQMRRLVPGKRCTVHVDRNAETITFCYVDR